MMSAHDDAPALGRPAPDRAAQPSRRLAMLAAVALLTGAVAAVHFEAAGSTDAVDASEASRRRAALEALGPLALTPVAAGDMPTELARSGLPAADQHTLAADAVAGRTRVLTLSVFDSDAEDGDVAEIRSSGFSQVVRLTKSPLVLAVPVGPDNMISIAGLVDGGGGGVTVGLVLPEGPILLPPLSVGQAIRLPVGPAR